MRYSGIRVKFVKSGTFYATNLHKVINELANAIIFMQLPTKLLLFVICSLLGQLSADDR